MSFYHLGEHEKALQDFKEAIKINEEAKAPQDPNVLYNRGNVYLNLNMFERARRDFDAASRLQPTRPKFYHAKGLTYEAEACSRETELLADKMNSQEHLDGAHR